MLSQAGLGRLPVLNPLYCYWPLIFILMSVRLSTSEIFSLKSLCYLLIALPPIELAGRSDIMLLESQVVLMSAAAFFRARCLSYRSLVPLA